MKWILKYLKPYWFFALMTPLTMIGEVAIDLIEPQLMSRIVNDGVLGGDMALIIRTGLLMFGAAVLGGIAGLSSAGFGSAASQNLGSDLRCDVFARVTALSFEQTDRFTTGSLITRMTNDITQIQDFVASALRMFVRSSLMFIGGIFMIMRINTKFGIVLACSLPVQVLAMTLLLRKAAPLFGVVQTKLDKVNSVVQEVVGGARVVKAYVREDYECERFGRANDDLMGINLRVMRIMAVLGPIMMIVMNISVVAIIYTGGLQVEARAMNVGSVMAAITYVTQILMSVMMVSMMFQMISRASASAKRVKEVLNTMPAVEGGDFDGKTESGTVEFRNVSFSYPGYASKTVLDGISLKIEQGESVAILGATGTGKTSLVGLIPRFYDATQGEVLVGGRNVKDYTLDALRSGIAVVLQKSELFSGTISENLRWGNEEATDDEVRLAAQIAQADGFISGMPEGYDTVIGEKGSSLSGGQKQRLSIARAILKKPSVLIMDDSTSALDLSTEAKLRTALRENLRGTTVITIAQRIASVTGADKIAVLENGRLCAIGTHEQLLKESPVYLDIYNSQMRRGAAV